MDFITDRDKAVSVALLAQEAKLYQDMVEAMKYVATTVSGLMTEGERRLFAEGYRRLISTRRESLTTLSKKVDELTPDDPNVVLINRYKRRVEADATEICNEVLSILEQHLIPYSEFTPEAFVLYTTLKGDVHRYLTEFKTGPNRLAAVADAILAYETATDVAETQLSRAHPLRLILDMNHSVLYHNVLKNASRAEEIVDETFELAIPALYELHPEAYQQSNAILLSINTNINAWGGPDPNIFGDGGFTFTVPIAPKPEV